MNNYLHANSIDSEEVFIDQFPKDYVIRKIARELYRSYPKEGMIVGMPIVRLNACDVENLLKRVLILTEQLEEAKKG